jgi:hypothetical protein
MQLLREITKLDLVLDANVRRLHRSQPQAERDRFIRVC